MKQSFRPLGVTSYTHESLSNSVFITYTAAKKPGKFDLIYRPYLFNRGKGVLSYIGSISYLSMEEISFRNQLLKGELDSIAFDALYSYARRTPIHPDGYHQVGIMMYDISIEEKYFLYTLFLYEDQDGTLYDTERLDVLLFEKEPQILNNALLPKPSGSFSKEKYSVYNDKERHNLVREIRKHNLPMAEVLDLN
ncbi:MAG: hypothetical protein AB1746_16805 [Candidatus Zixiibacteriota bacterium]